MAAVEAEAEGKVLLRAVFRAEADEAVVVAVADAVLRSEAAAVSLRTGRLSVSTIRSATPFSTRPRMR